MLTYEAHAWVACGADMIIPVRTKMGLLIFIKRLNRESLCSLSSRNLQFMDIIPTGNLQILFLSSKNWFVIWIEFLAGFQDTKNNVNQFPHNRTDNNFSIFTFFF